MAPKNKSRLVDQPPSASSSEEQVEESQEEEEEESGGEEESEEESEEEQEQEPKTVEKKPQTTQKPVQTPTKPQASSSSETQNGSGSESEAESGSGQSQPSPSLSAFTVKPHVPSKTSTKRPQETKEKDSKRNKKPKIQEEEEKKSATTPIRLWSDEDQVAVLKGMVEFKNQKGTEPNSDMSAFHDFIKGKLQAEVSKSQLSDKLRRLKKKFLTNVKDGEEPVFFKPNDNLVFEYSKKIWGGGKSDNVASSNGVVKENVKNSTDGKAKKAVEVKKSVEPKKSGKVSNVKKPKDDEKEKHKEEEKEKQVAVKEVVKEDNVVKGGDRQDFQAKYPRLAASVDGMADLSLRYPNAANMLKENMSLLASDKAKELEEKWKKLEEDEADLMVKRLDLISEHYRMVVDAMRGN
ncbi:STOREKEEPER protein-like [Lycium barbarum]|uniref:STOREKEEPER protein-like n=1 Tax=Lycium barbarum TaxID=112863 RepID=UPI00293E8C9F|nr:STOREKEEPER protein-like [Lycium barbarum]